jgi:hypothetical protein
MLIKKKPPAPSVRRRTDGKRKVGKSSPVATDIIPIAGVCLCLQPELDWMQMTLLR